MKHIPTMGCELCDTCAAKVLALQAQASRGKELAEAVLGYEKELSSSVPDISMRLWHRRRIFALAREFNKKEVK